MSVEFQTCTYCGKQFKNKNSLQKHISLSHREAHSSRMNASNFQLINE